MFDVLMRLLTIIVIFYRSVMSRISPQQRPHHRNNNNNNNLSVEFSRSGSGLQTEEDQVRINLEPGPDHDYLHPLNDLNQYNRVVSQVAPDYNYNSHNLNRNINKNSWGSTLPNQCLDNIKR